MKDFVSVKGAQEHNLKNVSVDIPRNALVVFTGVSGSGKSSLAFGTLYAEAQRRYLESVSPYARRLFNQMPVPQVEEIEGLPPAIALAQQRGTPSTRSSVGSVTTLSNLLRMLYSRAGTYPKNQELIYAEGFSPNTPEGACPTCHGLGRIYDATEKSMVPDDSLTIRERAIAAWPPAWHGQNLRDMLVTMGFDIDTPWKKMSKKDRDWILFTDETPHVPVYAGFSSTEVKKAIKKKLEPSYHGNFSSARNFVLTTFATTQSPLMKKRVSRYMVSALCPECDGQRLRKESLSVKFAGLNIGQMNDLPLKKMIEVIKPFIKDKNVATQRICEDLVGRIEIILDLGLGYLSLNRSTPTLSPGELQRLRLATQVKSNLFGVVYVLDEPSAGLHPSDTEALLRAFKKLKDQGNTLFVVEHEIDVIHEADWIVDVGPLAGQHGGEILYSGPPRGLLKVKNSLTANYIFGKHKNLFQHQRRHSDVWLHLKNLTRNNLNGIDVSIPLGVLTSVTGISGSGKSTLVSQLLIELVQQKLGLHREKEEKELDLEVEENLLYEGRIESGMDYIKRLVQVDQKAIGRTPRSNLATYTGLFDHVRKIFSETKMAKQRKYNAGRFSFNMAHGRCEKCEGEGFVMVELLFLPSVYSPCPLCHGSRYNAATLEVKYKEKSIADILNMTVDTALIFFKENETVSRPLQVLTDVGLGYLRLGQPATELSGGEAQRIKLATELQRPSKGETLYVLDEPTTGLHPADVEKLLIQLNRLVEAGNTVVVVEHDMRVVSSSDWIVDMGPGAGDEGGHIVYEGTPERMIKTRKGKTWKYLAAFSGNMNEHIHV